MSFTGKTVVVTGASAGIGHAVAESFARQGANVAICARNRAHLNRAATSIGISGVPVLAVPCDVSSRTQVESFFDEVESEYGPVDILVNNAGIGGPTPLNDDSDERWRLILAVTLDGSFFCTRRAAQKMPDDGRVINFSSVLGRFGVPGYAAYTTAKHGVIGLTRALALELAPRKITVNSICPGWVETDMARSGMQAGADSQGISYEQFRADALKAVPLQEIIPPSEIAALVCFLASPAARNITGQAYNICGGQIMN